MVAEINHEFSSATRSTGICCVHIDNPDTPGVDFLGSFRGYVDGALAPDDAVWTWENPNEAFENVTLSPSIRLQFGETNEFHGFVRDGDLEHCDDCGCGCRSCVRRIERVVSQSE